MARKSKVKPEATDFFGKTLFPGSLIVVSNAGPQLFGFVTVLGKSYIDACIVDRVSDERNKVRIKNPTTHVVLIEPANVSSFDRYFETVKLEASKYV